ncbi:MAG TPA: NAD(P)/FAD-dependent oxidoreductase [Candidatus Limnocylindrales bacterium]|jgi:phytoene dehydrogenase-like protein|nr:NAD(P)/FAD-dependent oxidoreductase [Candidatus Limnocylindrales bacterium]
MAESFDAIVVGGGHNGLICAAYLARAGLKPLVLERRAVVGGAAVTEEPWPGFKVSTLSYVQSLMPPRIIRELELAKRGYKVYPMGPYFLAFPDGSGLVFYEEPGQRHAEFARFSRRDADRYPEYVAWMDRLADVVRHLFWMTPPKLGSRSLPDLLDQLRFAWRLRGLGGRGVADLTRILTMSAGDLLDDWFESDRIKAGLSVDSVIGTWAGPYDSGTAYVLLHHEMGTVAEDGTPSGVGGWGFVEGGMGAISRNLAEAVVEYGGSIRTAAPVSRILATNGVASGVVLEDGEEIRTSIVISNAHPQITFLRLLDRADLPAEFVADIEGYDSRSGTVKVNLAISELPNFVSHPGTHVQPHHTGSVELAHSMDYAQRAFEDARQGEGSRAPFCDGAIATTLDHTLAPEGMHIFSMFAQWVPESWHVEPHRDEVEAFADRLIDGYTELAPNLKASIVHRQVIGPYDMEHEYGLIGGNIFHGELTLNQLFHMRPAPGYADYRTPIRGLYQCGSSTHPGGGVTGLPGRNAAREILRDRRRVKVR